MDSKGFQMLNSLLVIPVICPGKQDLTLKSYFYEIFLKFDYQNTWNISQKFNCENNTF